MGSSGSGHVSICTPSAHAQHVQMVCRAHAQHVRTRSVCICCVHAVYMLCTCCVQAAQLLSGTAKYRPQIYSLSRGIKGAF